MEGYTCTTARALLATPRGAAENGWLRTAEEKAIPPQLNTVRELNMEPNAGVGTAPRAGCLVVRSSLRVCRVK